MTYWERVNEAATFNRLMFSNYQKQELKLLDNENRI